MSLQHYELSRTVLAIVALPEAAGPSRNALEVFKARANMYDIQAKRTWYSAMRRKRSVFSTLPTILTRRLDTRLTTCGGSKVGCEKTTWVGVWRGRFKAQGNDRQTVGHQVENLWSKGIGVRTTSCGRTCGGNDCETVLHARCDHLRMRQIEMNTEGKVKGKVKISSMCSRFMGPKSHGCLAMRNMLAMRSMQHGHERARTACRV